MTIAASFIALVALAIGVLIGWLFAGRQAGGLKAERDGLAARFKTAVADLAAEAAARKAADLQYSALLAGQKARAAGYYAQIEGLQGSPAARPQPVREVGQARPTRG